jgi:ABC-type bacteriocin/lantibiotic exporter with double-glycine peptidase domain
MMLPDWPTRIMRNLSSGSSGLRGKVWAITMAFVAWNLVCATPCAMKKGFYLEVPYVLQVKSYCGPATLAMVFRYWGSPADQHELASGFQPFPRKGLRGAQLKELAAEYGFVAYSFSGTTGLVLDHLSKGRPLIVALSSSRLLNLNHYLVLVGWDAACREWIVHDPADGPYQRLSAEKFSGRWAALDNWTLLVLPETGE